MSEFINYMGVTMKYIMIMLLIAIYACGDGYCEAEFMPVGADTTYLRMIGIQPNPIGDSSEVFFFKNYSSEKELEYYHYTVESSNGTTWYLSDLEGWGFSISPCEEFDLISKKREYLSDEGEKVYLLRRGDTIQTIEYGPAGEGEIIWFNQEKKNSSDE